MEIISLFIRSDRTTSEVPAMYAKFPFYSVAQMYAITLNTPVSILLGRDNLYWVVAPDMKFQYMGEGCALLCENT
jgi:hypothetical protein